MKNLIFRFLTVLLAANWAAAAPVSWINPAGGNWSDTNSWSGQFVPGPSDDVSIALAGTYSVLLDVSASVQSLALGGATGAQTLTNNGATLTAGSGVVGTNGVLALGGGTVSGVILLQGQMLWTAGTVGPGSALTVAANGLLVLAGATNIDYSLEGTLTNAGTIRMASGNLQLLGPNYNGSFSGELVNLPGGLIDLQSDVSIDHYSGEFFINQGVVRKSGGTGVSAISPIFDNSGTVDARTGTVSLVGGGSVDGAQLTGAGTNLFAAGEYMLGGVINASNAVLAGATFTGSNGFLGGSWIWTSGLIEAGSTLSVATNGVFTLAGQAGTDYALEGALTNFGTIRLTSGNLQILGPNYNGSYSGELINLPGALVDFQGDVSIDHYSGEVFVNQGVVRKSGGAGLSQINTAFNNTGVLDVQTGSLALAGGGNGNGQFISEAGTALIVSGGYEMDQASVTGAGTNFLTGGTFILDGSINSTNVVLAGAALGGSNGVINSMLTWTSGSIAPGSTLTVASNAVLVMAGGTNTDYSVEGALTNAGTIRVASGNFQLLGPNYNGTFSGALVNLPGALIDLQSDASIDHYSGELFINQGTVRKSGGTGVSSIYPIFNNSGALDARTGAISLVGSGSVDGAQLTGAGTNLFSSGVYTLGGVINASNAVLAGATLTGTNALLGGIWTWTSGLIAPGSTLTVAANGTLVLAGATNSENLLEGVLTNAGTIRLVNGNLQILGPNYNGSYSGELVNLPGGLVDFQSDVSIDHYSGELFVNEGVARKSGGTGVSSINTAFDNSGTLDVRSGTLNLAGGGSGTGQFLSEAGTALMVSGGYEMDNTSVTGAGTNLLTGGAFLLDGSGLTSSNLVLAGAALGGTNGVIDTTLVWTSGSIAPGSTLTVATNGILVLAGQTNTDYSVEGALTNAGTIRLVSGNLQLLGPNYNGAFSGELINLPGGLVDLQSDSSIDNYSGELFINEGVVRKSGGVGVSQIGPVFDNPGVLDAQSGVIKLTGTYDLAGGTLNFGLNSLTSFGQINLTGAIPLDGTVSANFNNGYSPIEGNSFPVLTYGVTNGMFTNFTLPGQIAWQTSYSLTALTLTVLNVAPSLAQMTNQSVRELTLLAAAEVSTDPDLPPQTLTFGLVSGPAGLTVNAQSGLVSWTPAQTQSPSTNTVVVRVTDNGTPALSTTNSFQVVVIEVNTAPVLGSLPAQSVIQQNQIVLTNAAAESNIHATLGYTLVNPPAGAAIDTNGVIRWTPAPAQAPSTNVIVTVVTNTDVFDLVNPHLSATNSVTVIARAIPVLTWPAPADITYGTALSPAQLDATANTTGSFVYVPPLGTALGAGSNQTLSVTFTPSDLSGYATAAATVHLNVRQARPVITWANPADITYPKPLGATQLDATASVTGTFSYAPPSGTVLPAGAAQTIAVTFTPLDTIDFVPATTNVSINVLKALLTATANNTNRVYGAANPSLTAGYSGFVNGDGPSALSGALALTTTATPGSPVGSYPITAALGTLAATNYTFAFDNGALTVNPASLTVTANAANRLAGATNPVFTASFSGFVNGDGSSVIGGSPAFATTAVSNSAAGSYPITVTQGTLSATNYTFGAFVPGVLTVTSPSSSVVLIDVSRTGGTFSVSVESVTGSTYILEYKNTLTTASWTEGPTVAGTGALITLVDPTASPSTRFYRVRITTP